jgi:tetratricopeptide (TPR) repeat protein
MAELPSNDSVTVKNSGNLGALAINGSTAITTIENHYSGLAPEMLHEPIRSILATYRSGDTEMAKEQLNILGKMSNQDPSVELALSIVSIYLNVLDIDKEVESRRTLTEYLSQTVTDQPPGILYDLCMASLLRLEVRSGDSEKAHRVWQSCNAPGPHTKETYFTFMAEASELEIKYSSDGCLMTAPELKGLIEGALRLNLNQLAEKVFKQLSSLDNSPSTRALSFFVKASKIQEHSGGRHLWSVTANIYDDLMQLAEEMSELLLLEPLPDSRLPLSAALLLTYLLGEPECLNRACWEKIKLIERVDKQRAALLCYQYNQDHSRLDDIMQNSLRALKDEAFRQKHIDELSQSLSLSSDKCLFLARHAQPGEIDEWLERGGKCDEEDAIVRELINLYMLCRATEAVNHNLPTTSIKDNFNVLSGASLKNISSMNPEFVVELAWHLMQHSLPNEACLLIEPILPNQDWWLSPLTTCYLKALAQAEKFSTLSNTFSKIPIHLWDENVWHIKAHLEIRTGKLSEAKKSLDNGLALNPTARIAATLIDVLQELEMSDEISSVFDKCPDNTLKPQDTFSRRLLIEMFKSNLQDRAENILLDWFLEDPQKHAMAITEVYNHLITHLTPINYIGSGKNKSLIGIRYHNGSQSLTKILVPQEKAKGEYLMSTAKPLGQRLSVMSVGEEFQEGMITYRVEERLLATVAAYRISSEIRNSMNAGDDAFHILTLPEDNPAELLDQLRKMMAVGDESMLRILKLDNLPIMFKGHHLKAGQPFNAAIGLLSDKQADKTPLPLHQPGKDLDSMLLDVYAVSYLAITGLAYGLIKSNLHLVMSIETAQCIKHWLMERQNKNGGMMISLPNGTPYLFTAEEQQIRTAHIAEYAEALLVAATVAHPEVADLSPEFLALGNMVDLSVFSTIRLALTNDIPWLCIDLSMANIAIKLNCPLVCCQSIIEKASDLALFSEKKNGLYRMAFEQLPFTLKFQDLLELSRDKEITSVEALTKILRQYPKGFTDLECATWLMGNLFMQVLANAYNKGWLPGIALSIEDARFPSHIASFAYACFFVSTQSNSDKTAEQKIAFTLHSFITKFADTGLPQQLLTHLVDMIVALANKFILGHFLDIELINQEITQLVGKQRQGQDK